jgi:3-oxoacyl-[acyl-carrier protein] reductase
MRSALITGASRGIGLGIAGSLARQGFGLTITSRTAEDLEELAVRLQSLGSPAVEYLACDMADRDALTDLMSVHESRFDLMNVLVLNAGVGTGGTLASFKMERYDRTLEVNLTSAVLLLQRAVPLLRRAAEQDLERGATVIALSSITGAYAEGGLGVYGATKAALLSLVETFNVEESGNGVTATALAPAYVDTDMTNWVNDRIPGEAMIPVADVVKIVDLLVGLSARTVINRMVLSRSGTNGYCP